MTDNSKERNELLKQIYNDDLVKLTKKKNYSTEDLIKLVLRDASEEKSRLRLLRDQTPLETDEQLSISKRVGDLLKQIGDLSINLHKAMSVNEINLRSEGFKVLMSVMLSKLQEALENSRVSDEVKETVFNEYADSLESLEADYKKELKGKGLK